MSGFGIEAFVAIVKENGTVALVVAEAAAVVALWIKNGTLSKDNEALGRACAKQVQEAQEAAAKKLAETQEAAAKKLEESRDARLKEMTRVIDAVNSNTSIVEALERAVETLERIISGRGK